MDGGPRARAMEESSAEVPPGERAEAPLSLSSTALLTPGSCPNGQGFSVSQ